MEYLSLFKTLNLISARTNINSCQVWIVHPSKMWLLFTHSWLKYQIIFVILTKKTLSIHRCEHFLKHFDIWEAFFATVNFSQTDLHLQESQINEHLYVQSQMKHILVRKYHISERCICEIKVIVWHCGGSIIFYKLWCLCCIMNVQME